MVLWEFVCAPCVTDPHTHHRDRVRLSSAFNTGPLKGVLLILKEPIND